MNHKLLIIPILFITLFTYVNNVNADTIEFTYQEYAFTEERLVSYIELVSQELIDYWQEHFSNDYPNYYIGLGHIADGTNINSNRIDVYLHYSEGFNGTTRFYGNLLNVNYNSATHVEHAIVKSAWCDESSNCSYSSVTEILNNANIYYKPTFMVGSSSALTGIYWPLTYYDSNFNWVYNLENNSIVKKDDSTILTLEPSDIIPTYKQLNGITPSTYTEINLNNYDYITLSLKDYTLRNDNINQFSTPIFTIGNLCLTPVYNYGMNEKKNYYSGYQVQGCSDRYTSFTPVDVYILKQDLENHVVYYIKPSNYSYDNIIKVDTSIFDITTFTSSDNSPQVVINGRSYPVIPFNDLTDTANKSTEEGYVSGKVCAIGDINCTASQNEFSIDDIFTAPLQTLRTVWSSIVSVFALITSFIVLLPPTLQAFLYASFFLAIILGLLKIIL